MINPYVYSNDNDSRVKRKVSEPGFCGNSWSDNDIEDIREDIKRHYIAEQKYTCFYCMQVLKTNNGRVWDIEHIIPRETEKNFMFYPLNLCVSCIDCNSKKGIKKVTNSKAKS